jgi:hypothetical protein
MKKKSNLFRNAAALAATVLATTAALAQNAPTRATAAWSSTSWST